MRVIYHNSTRSDADAYRSIDDLLAEADIVSLHTPLTPQTHHLIDAARLGQMKASAYLINMARGQ